MQVQSQAVYCGLRIWNCPSCGLGCNWLESDPGPGTPYASEHSPPPHLPPKKEEKIGGGREGRGRKNGRGPSGCRKKRFRKPFQTCITSSYSPAQSLWWLPSINVLKSKSWTACISQGDWPCLSLGLPYPPLLLCLIELQPCSKYLSVSLLHCIQVSDQVSPVEPVLATTLLLSAFLHLLYFTLFGEEESSLNPPMFFWLV